MKRKKIRRSFWILSVVSFLFLTPTMAALAEEYPARPITILCWSSPGAPNDLLARQIAKTGEKYFGQRMDVLTKRGGSGATAMSYLDKQKKDGYALSTNTASMVINIASGRVPFKISGFTFLMRIQLDPFLIAVRSDSPFKDLKDFFDYAKKNPGKLSISGFGTASAHFLAFMRLKARAGNPEVRWVAYEGGADAATACLGGHTNLVHTNYAVVGEHVKAGKMRVLGVSSGERLSALPEVKIYREQGYPLDPVHWRGFMGPAGLTPGVVKKIRSSMEKTVMDPEFKTYMKNAGAEYGLMESPGAFQKWAEQEVLENRDLMKKLNLLKKKK